MSLRFSSVEEILKLINEIPLSDREKLLAAAVKELPIDARSRVMGLSDTGVTLVTGSFVSLNSEVAVNIQNSDSNFDPETLIKALIDYHRSRHQNNS